MSTSLETTGFSSIYESTSRITPSGGELEFNISPVLQNQESTSKLCPNQFSLVTYLETLRLLEVTYDFIFLQDLLWGIQPNEGISSSVVPSNILVYFQYYTTLQISCFDLVFIWTEVELQKLIW